MRKCVGQGPGHVHSATDLLVWKILPAIRADATAEIRKEDKKGKYRKIHMSLDKGNKPNE